MKTSEPLNQEAYRRIKEYILNSDFYPGQHIRHVEVSESLGMSRTPLREAMQRLVEEGFLKHIPNRGYFVNEITKKEAEELYELREILETYCIKKAIQKWSTKDAKEIRKLVRTYRQTIDGQVSRQTLLLDRNFHLKLAKLADNDLVYRTLLSVFEKIIMKRNIEGISPSDGMAGVERHQKILNAIENRNQSEALRQVVEHIREGKRRVVQQTEQRKRFRL